MKSMQQVVIVARTEMLLCVRSWVFRFHVLLVASVAAIANLLLFLPDHSWVPVPPWSLRAIPSSVPYFNTLVLTMIGSLFLIFSSIDTFRRDYTFNTSASIHAHDFATIWFVIGKAIGVITPFIILEAFILAVVLVVNKVFMSDVPVAFPAYLLYPLIITASAYLFMTGMSFLVMSIVKHASAALMIMLGVFLIPFIVISGLPAHLFDYNAIHLPLLHSDFVGFGNAPEILLHRGLFLFLGLGLTSLSALRFDRLSQSQKSRRVATIATYICILASVFSCALFFGGEIREQHIRNNMQALNEEYVSMPRARLSACDLDVLHQGSKLTVEAQLTLTNHRSEPLDRVCLSLNPGFAIDTITNDGQLLTYTRDTQIIDIALSGSLIPGESQVVTVTYHGAPDDGAMYPDVPARNHRHLNRIVTHVIDKRHAFVTPNYVLLTPESLWYPVSGIPYGMVFPDAYEKDFIDFTLDVTTGDGLTVVSQGMVTDNGNGVFTVCPETKLTGLTLIAGEYEKRSMVFPGEIREFDGLEFRELELVLFTKPGHDYFTPYTTGHEEVFFSDLPRQKKNFEARSGTFPYHRFLYVEVPVQFYAYNRNWGMPADTMQPQINLLPEKGCYLQALDLRNAYDRIRKGLVERGQVSTDSDIANSLMRELSGFVFQSVVTIFQNSPRQRLFSLFDNLDRAYVPDVQFQVQYGPLLYNVESQVSPLLSAVFERFIRGNYNTYTLNTMDRYFEALSDAEIVCMVLKDIPYREFLTSVDDVDLLDKFLNLKTAQLFGELESLTGSMELYTFRSDYFNNHRFESIPLESFAAAIDSAFGVDIYQAIDHWSTAEGLPFYEIGDIEVVEITSDELPVYQSTVTITNTSQCRGIVEVYAQTMRNQPVIYCIDGNQTVKISQVTETRPLAIDINTIISKNLPIGVSYSLQGNEPRKSEIEPFDGFRVLDYRPQSGTPGIIVVDNLDPGFKIVADMPGLPDKFDHGFGENPEGFICIDLDEPPSWWGKAVFGGAYGMQKTAYYTKTGSGDRQVCWSADIPEVGWYDIEYYIPDLVGIGRPEMNPQFLVMLNFTIRHAGTDDNITFTVSDATGWQYMSSFELDPGPVDVILTNESDGTMVYADAIRWVKR